MPQVKVSEQSSRIVCITESKTLPDGNIVFDCSCGKTVARTVDREGYRKIKIMLTGRAVYERAGDISSVVDGRSVRAGARWGSQKIEAKPDDRPHFDLGGRCQQCNKRVQPSLSLVLQAVGFDDLKDFQQSYGLEIEDALDCDLEKPELFDASMVFLQFVHDDFHGDIASFPIVEGEEISEKQKII